MSDGEVKSKAMKMFFTTKGRRYFRLKEEFIDKVIFDDIPHEGDGHLMMTKYQATSIAKANGMQIEEMFHKPKWVGGTESAMFNRLEEIAGK